MNQELQEALGAVAADVWIDTIARMQVMGAIELLLSFVFAILTAVVLSKDWHAEIRYGISVFLGMLWFIMFWEGISYVYFPEASAAKWLLS